MTRVVPALLLAIAALPISAQSGTVPLTVEKINAHGSLTGTPAGAPSLRDLSKPR